MVRMQNRRAKEFFPAPHCIHVMNMMMTLFANLIYFFFFFFFGLWVTYCLTCMLVLSSLHNAVAWWANLMSASPSLLMYKRAFWRWSKPRRPVTKTTVIAHCTRCWEQMNRSLAFIGAPCRDSGAFVGEGDPFSGPEREEMGLLMYVRCRQISIGTISLQRQKVAEPIMKSVKVWRHKDGELIKSTVGSVREQISGNDGIMPEWNPIVRSVLLAQHWGLNRAKSRAQPLSGLLAPRDTLMCCETSEVSEESMISVWTPLCPKQPELQQRCLCEWSHTNKVSLPFSFPVLGSALMVWGIHLYLHVPKVPLSLWH